MITRLVSKLKIDNCLTLFYNSLPQDLALYLASFIHPYQRHGHIQSMFLFFLLLFKRVHQTRWKYSKTILLKVEEEITNM